MSLEERTKRHEGFRSTVYDDATGKPIVKGSILVGNPTIGYGTLLSAPGGISEATAEVLMINKYKELRSKFSSVPAYINSPEPIKEVLLEMAYQMGFKGLLSFTATIGAIGRGEYKIAAEHMRNSLWYKQTPNRAEELIKIVEAQDDVRK